MRESIAAVIFFAARLLCGCTVETALDSPGGGILFTVAFVVCVAVAIIYDKKL